MTDHTTHLRLLREELQRQKLDGFVVPVADEHLNENIGSHAKRLAWLTGFNGSAGSAVILRDQAAVFIDGRYTSQAAKQVDQKDFEVVSTAQTSMTDWLIANITSPAQIGFDPWLHTRAWVDGMETELGEHSISLVEVGRNPIDQVWHDRPHPSDAVATVHDVQYSGRPFASKLSEAAEWLKSENYDLIAIASLISIAWLLNIRGSDVDYTPVARCFLIVDADGLGTLYIAPEKVKFGLRRHLNRHVIIRDYSDFVEDLAAFRGMTVSVDPEDSPWAIARHLKSTGANVVFKRDPTILPRALKNKTEQEGQRAAQQRDGAAVARFLFWLDQEAPNGKIDELSAAAKMREVRQDCRNFRDLSFDTVSAVGPNAALPHYTADETSNRPIGPNGVYLVDSGGQYLDGTTDITRTVWIGPKAPTQEMIERNTLVLKGHIALASAIFPEGTTGGQLDTLARQFLWQVGLDYAHGTGHGVGSFLSVHEGPQRISRPTGGASGTEQQLLPGMILSNEPAYYKPGYYGIRIENLVMVEKREIDQEAGAFLGFETLSYVPFDRRLICKEMLSAKEIDWVDEYHSKTLERLALMMPRECVPWLVRQCAEL